MDTTGREAKLQEINLKIDNHNSNIEKNKIPLGNELIKFLGINRARTLFNEEKIISWIKIETLILDFYPNIYSTKSFNIILKIKEKNSFDQKIQDETREEYVNWVQESYNNINTIFTDSDINTLKDLSKKIDSFLIFRDFHNYEEWMDLFDLISVNKKNELKGQISFYLNLMSVKRYIDRFL